MVSRWLQPEALVWGGRLLRDVALGLAADGTCETAGTPPAGAMVERLPGKLLLPGLVNAHSHAFQRLLRGRTQAPAAGRAQDDFWTWRETMYRAAVALDPDGVGIASRQCFLEMARAGITTVGEFHYLHHAPDGRPYTDPLELALRVITAAREVGLRIHLLRVGYARAGFNAPPDPRQRRFYDPDPATFLGAVAALEQRVRPDLLVTVGAAPHSVRAVPRPWLEAVARARPRTVHVHVAEQPREVEACLTEHGRRPVELLSELGLLDSRFTAVHAVHLAPHEIPLLAPTSVCACPLTERDLGDGILPADALAAAGATLCIGTDGQNEIDPFGELRALEGDLRLQRGRRLVLPPTGEGLDAIARSLLEAATHGGARSLGLDVGRLAPGRPADLCAVDLGHPALLGAPEDGLLAAVVFSAPASAVTDTWVQGRRVVQDGRHPLEEAMAREFTALCRRTFA
ncbi:MAG TPA: formimidoylglutamate deiminase [Myxococcaceae bacterium]|nr:formimidoylglutamate deiminase [Myxococcaceae bacterium]